MIPTRSIFSEKLPPRDTYTNFISIGFITEDCKFSCFRDFVEWKCFQKLLPHNFSARKFDAGLQRLGILNIRSHLKEGG